MKIGQTSFIGFITKFSSSFIGFIATIYVTRTLGSSVFGEYTLAVSLVIWLQVLGVLGVQSAVAKRLSEVGDSDSYFTAGAGMILIVFLIISITILFFNDQINSYVGRPVAVYLPILLLGSMTLSFVSASLRGIHKVHIAALLEPVDRLIRGILQIIVVILSIGLTGLLVSYAVGGIIAALCGLYYLSVGIKIPTKQELRSVTSYAQYAWLGKLSSRAFSAMDTVILGWFVTSSLVAYYEVAWNLASLLAILSVAIRRALFPEISQTASKGDIEQVEGLVTDGLSYAGLFLIPGLFGSLAIGDLILRVYGNEFQRAMTVLVILIISRLVYEYANQFITGLNGLDRPDLAFRINLIFIVSNIVLNISLISIMGWVGAAIATSTSAAVALIISYYLFNKLVNIPLPTKEFASQFIAAICMMLMILIGRKILPETVFAGIGLVGIGAIIYLLVLAKFSNKFRTTVRRNIPKLELLM